jgi:peptidoglycan DL-endopeptidase LytE
MATEDRVYTVIIQQNRCTVAGVDNPQLSKRRFFMMRRQVLLWISLGALLASWSLCGDGHANSTYHVQKNDTLSSISERFGVTSDALRTANNLTESNLKPQQVLIIPSPSVSQMKPQHPSSSCERIYQVKKGDTLAKIASKTGFSLAYIREVNRLKGSALKIGQKIELYRSQDSEAAKIIELVTNQTKSELESEEKDCGITDDEAWTDAERHEQGNTTVYGQWSNPEEERLFVKVAMGFLGTPYRLGGSSVTGLDCSGFVKKIYQLFNIHLPRTAFEQSLVGLRVRRSELVAGDLLFFNTRRRFGHVGIYIGNNEFVHASSRKRRVYVDNLNMSYFNKRFVRAVRLKESNNEEFVTNRRPTPGG